MLIAFIEKGFIQTFVVFTRLPALRKRFCSKLGNFNSENNNLNFPKADGQPHHQYRLRFSFRQANPRFLGHIVIIHR